jgi:hypothetical protein
MDDSLARVEELVGGEPEFVRKPSGYILMDGKEVAHTLQCGHCGAHWVPIKGSGRVRGFCSKCNKVLCGAEKCLRYHIPIEVQLDFQDGGGRSAPAATRERIKIVEKFPGLLSP